MKISKHLVKWILAAGFSLAPLAAGESVQAESLPEESVPQTQEVMLDDSSQSQPAVPVLEQTETLEETVESQEQVSGKVTVEAEPMEVEPKVEETVEEEAAVYHIEAKEKGSQSSTTDQAQVDRVSGDTRYTNAVEVSKAGWTKADDVFLANGDNYADALTGAPLAHLRNAPILLTRANRLENSTLQEIIRLQAKHVTVLGGKNSIHESVVQTLKDRGLKVQRIGGINRYHQAALVADEIEKVKGKNRDAFLASGNQFADALSIAEAAASRYLPIYLTEGDRLNEYVAEASKDVSSFIIVGGPRTIQSTVENRLRSLGHAPVRFSGLNRYEVNRNLLSYYSMPRKHLYIVSGEDYADALTASVLAAKKNSGLLFVKNDNTSVLQQQADFAIGERGIQAFTLIGGSSTLSPNTLKFFSNYKKQVPQPPKNTDSKNVPLIFLDPGHGGSDPGAMAYGAVEKDLNLIMSKKIEKLLKDKGYAVATSRDSDVAVSMVNRSKMANDLGADLFISLHHNAIGTSSVSGIETFYYKSSPNYPPQINWSMHNDPARLRNSERLAHLVQDQLVAATGAKYRRVDGMAFVVIKEAAMPAVLTEFGFLTHPTENAKLKSDAYQNTMAAALVRAVDQYFGR